VGICSTQAGHEVQELKAYEIAVDLAPVLVHPVIQPLEEGPAWVGCREAFLLTPHLNSSPTRSNRHKGFVTEGNSWITAWGCHLAVCPKSCDCGVMHSWPMAHTISALSSYCLASEQLLFGLDMNHIEPKAAAQMAMRYCMPQMGFPTHPA